MIVSIGRRKIKGSGDDIMGAVLMLVSIIGVLLLIYLFYILFRGDQL
jgi:hypothetical protein